MIISVYLIKLIGIDLILINKSFIEQLIDVILIFTVPTVIITWILLMVNYVLKAEKRIQQTYENLVIQDDIMFDVENNEEGGEF